MIVAYPGDAEAAEAADPLWKLCNGRSLFVADHLALFQVIGWSFGRGDDKVGRTTFSLPDLRGYFLRGLDTTGDRDRGADERTDFRGLPVGPKLGSLQQDATRPARNPFRAAQVPAHRHEFPRGATWSGTNPGHAAFLLDVHRDFVPSEHMDFAGEHGHDIEGGDKETRPINVAVNWLIRCG
jgi:microcystin-dependent protein